jgi:hypothetical protein
MLSKAGASNVVPQNQDFLKVDPEDPQYSNVTHMYVSGISDVFYMLYDLRMSGIV